MTTWNYERESRGKMIYSSALSNDDVYVAAFRQKCSSVPDLTSLQASSGFSVNGSFKGCSGFKGRLSINSSFKGQSVDSGYHTFNCTRSLEDLSNFSILPSVTVEKERDSDDSDSDSEYRIYCHPPELDFLEETVFYSMPACLSFSSISSLSSISSRESFHLLSELNYPELHNGRSQSYNELKNSSLSLTRLDNFSLDSFDKCTRVASDSEPDCELKSDDYSFGGIQSLRLESLVLPEGSTSQPVSEFESFNCASGGIQSYNRIEVESDIVLIPARLSYEYSNNFDDSDNDILPDLIQFPEKVASSISSFEDSFTLSKCSPNYLLRLYAWQGEKCAVEKLLLSADDEITRDDMILSCDGLKRNSLQLASEQGHTDIVELLFETISNRLKDNLVQASGWKDRTALHVAAMEGHADIVLLLFDNININQRDKLLNACDQNGRNALHYVSTEAVAQSVLLNSNRDQLIKQLLSQDREGLTPLHVSSIRTTNIFESIATVMEEKNVSAEDAFTLKDKLGNSVIHFTWLFKNEQNAVRALSMIPEPKRNHVVCELLNNSGKSAFDLLAEECTIPAYLKWIFRNTSPVISDSFSESLQPFILQKMVSTKYPGVGLVIINTKDRKSCDEEESCMKAAFNFYCHKVTTKKDLSAEDMIRAIQSTVKERASVIWIYIGTHGQGGDLLVDQFGRTIKLNTVIKSASYTRPDQPRIFFIQSCRGEHRDTLKWRLNPNEVASGMIDVPESWLKGFNEIATQPLAPKFGGVGIRFPNTLVLQSTLADTAALQVHHSDERPVFARTVEEVLTAANGQHNIFYLFTEVIDKIMRATRETQCPTIAGSLLKLLKPKPQNDLAEKAKKVNQRKRR